MEARFLAVGNPAKSLECAAGKKRFVLFSHYMEDTRMQPARKSCSEQQRQSGNL